MSIDINRRIRRPFAQDEFLRDLVNGTEPAFGTMADVLVFAAALAFSRGASRRSFEKSGEQIAASVFVNAQYDSFLVMLAIAVCGDANAADSKNIDQCLLIFEEYAAAGLEILAENLARDRRLEKTDVLRDLALEAFNERSLNDEPDFEKLLSGLDN